jgi:hypothetical protein
MNKLFFITGLPRSRTAWLANLLTYGVSHCRHDGLAECKSVDGLVDLMLGTNAIYSGDSDSGLLFFADRIKSLVPAARWVVVERDMRDAWKSYRNHFKAVPYPGTEGVSEASMDALWDTVVGAYDRTRNGLDAMKVSFDDLEKRNTVKAIWEWCIPEVPWNQHRYEMLQRMSVNVIPKKLRRPVFL